MFKINYLINLFLRYFYDYIAVLVSRTNFTIQSKVDRKQGVTYGEKSKASCLLFKKKLGQNEVFIVEKVCSKKEINR